MQTKSVIRFVLDGDVIEIDDVDPTRTVLQYLREDLCRKGSKEGCAEGDCGACTVVVAEIGRKGSGEAFTLRAINSCIQFLPTLDGKELITVESLSTPGENLHPVQQAMLDKHGSQCGFCTPGFVMSLYALYETNAAPSRRDIDDALAGNLCRCTGYRPIVAAANDMYTSDHSASLVHLDALKSVQRSGTLDVSHGERRFLAPQNSAALGELLQQHPDATILAGGTDIGLWVTKQHRQLGTIIYTGAVADLADIRTTAAHIDIGASVSLTDAAAKIVAHYPGLDELFRRFASPPIRNAGTLGGNVANGSPIGDSMAALMVIGTTLVLRSANAERDVSLDDFYLDYQINDLQPGEYLARIRIPLPDEGTTVTSQKWSKRFDQDISAVCTAYRLALDGDSVKSFRMACGGLASTVRRASLAEAELQGQLWNEAAIERACAALAKDFTPIGDMRASAAGRMHACQNLLRRFFLETQEDNLASVYSYGR